jgi:hypothetical protein
MKRVASGRFVFALYLLLVSAGCLFAQQATVNYGLILFSDP